MLGLAAEGVNPKEYGFQSFAGMEELKNILEEKPLFLVKRALPRYMPIQNRIRERMQQGECPEGLEWFCEIDLAARQKAAVKKELLKAKKRAGDNGTSAGRSNFRSWEFRKKLVTSFWNTYGRIHRGWRKEYVSFILEYTQSEWAWKKECNLLYKSLQSHHSARCRNGGLHRYRWKLFFCRAFFGTLANSDFLGEMMYKHDWRFNRKVITNGKLRFVDASLNSPEAIYLCENKIASARYWNKWYQRGWLAVGPGRSVTVQDLRKLLNGKNRLILKPMDDYGGHGVKVLEVRNEEELCQQVKIINKLDLPYILEEYIVQTGFLHDAHSSSLNTIRVITAKHRDGTVDIENMYARFGRNNSVIDNISSGGCEFYINPETGKFETGDDFNGCEYSAHPDSGVKITGEEVPHCREIVAYCKELHQQAPRGLNYVGWDICVSGDTILLVEVNNSPGGTGPRDGKPDLWKRSIRIMEEYDQ